MANHPFGGADALALGSLCRTHRADSLLLANRMTADIPAIGPLTIPLSILNEDAAARDADDALPYGSTESLGLEQGAVGFVDNAQYQSLVPESVRSAVADVVSQIADGSITVPSAF